jgi:hypothetical protein
MTAIRKKHPPRRCVIDGIEYTEGSKLQVIVPELGAIPVVVELSPHSTDMLITMDFVYIRTPLPCSMTGKPDGPNASLRLSFNRMPAEGKHPAMRSNTLQLKYFCTCGRKHTEEIGWQVEFDLGIARSRNPGMSLNGGPYRHPLVKGWTDLQPMSWDELNKAPVAGEDGQFKIF